MNRKAILPFFVLLCACLFSGCGLEPSLSIQLKSLSAAQIAKIRFGEIGFMSSSVGSCADLTAKDLANTSKLVSGKTFQFDFKKGN